MQRINVIIADSDQAYMKRLVSYLSENNKQLNISYFSDKQSFEKYFNEASVHFHILLFSEDMYSENIEKKRIELKMMLSDSSMPINGYKTINKYQRADDVLSEILMAFSEETGTTSALGSIETGSTRAIAVYSPIGGSGKTTIAIVLAKALAAAGRRVLYLNFEGVSSVRSVFSGVGTHSMSEVYLAAKTKNANVGLKVLQCKEVHYDTGIEFINAPECSAEYCEMTPAELRRIVKETKDIEQYEDIIVDMNSGYNDDIFEVLDVCDVVLLPYRNNKVSYNKMEDFADELEKLERLDTIGRKIVPVENCSNRISRENFGGMYVRACVPEVAALANIDNILYSDSNADIGQIISALG